MTRIMLFDTVTGDRQCSIRSHDIYARSIATLFRRQYITVGIRKTKFAYVGVQTVIVIGKLKFLNCKQFWSASLNEIYVDNMKTR